MEHLVITIGRENGSGGRHVGEELAKALGIKFYDKEILAETARQSGFAHEFIAENEEKKPQFFWGTGAFYMYEQPISVKLYIEQSKIIKQLAEKESCVIVGRCSDYVLHGYKNVVNVFVHAPLPARIARVTEREGLSEKDAKTRINKTDKARAAYYNYFTNQIWGEAKNYHLCVDTENLGIDGTVEMIKKYLELLKH